MSKPHNNPSPESQSHLVCNTVESLLPLYSGNGQDRPEGVLSEAPISGHITDALSILIDVMLPGRVSADRIDDDELSMYLTRHLSHAWRLLRPQIERAIPYQWTGEAARCEGQSSTVEAHTESIRVLDAFYGQFETIRKLVIEDIRAAYDGDPAALTYAEVQLSYPGLLAITSHRLAHELYKLNVPIVPRIMSEWTHAKTGVDIHPGATIGHGFFIDHATGVVIGETAEIGNLVKIYQSVTLGAKSFPLDENGNPIKHIKRHPTIEDQVVIYANSTILGAITIGARTTIGGNVFLMEDVAPNSFVASKHPELRIKTDRNVGEETDSA